MKANSDYFSHDYYARSDKKLQRLLMKETIASIGIYWCIVEKLYEEKGYLLRSEYECIAFELRTDCERIKSVVENFELFQFDDEKFWSISVLDRLKLRNEKSESAKKSADIKWVKEREKAVAMRSQQGRNANKVNKTKGLFTNIDEEQKSEVLPLEGQTSDFLAKRMEWYKKEITLNPKHPSIKGFTHFVDYICDNKSPILFKKSLLITDFSKVNSSIGNEDLELCEIMPKMDKYFNEFKSFEDSKTVLLKFIAKYYPKKDKN